MVVVSSVYVVLPFSEFNLINKLPDMLNNMNLMGRGWKPGFVNHKFFHVIWYITENGWR